MRIEANPSRPGLQLRADDGRATPIHPRWLRERIASPDQMDATNGQRLYDPSDLPEDLQVVEVTERAQAVWTVRFSDGGVGDFGAARLLDEAARNAVNTGLPPRLAWSGTLSPLPVLSWQPQPSDAALLRITEAFLRHGFVILRG